MPIGILTDEELERELNKPAADAPSRSLIIPMPNVGRKPDVANIPDVVKKVIAEERLNGASINEIQAAFNVSQPTITSATNGMNSASPDASQNEALTNHVRETKNKIIKRSSNKLMTALSQITAGRLQEASVRDASAIAKDMSQIIRNLEEPVDRNKSANQANFVFFAPQQKSIDQYDVITVND